MTTAWALVRPLERQLPVFPYASGGPHGNWVASATGWAEAGLFAGAVLGLVLTREGRRWERIAG